MKPDVEIAGVLLGRAVDGRWRGRCRLLGSGEAARVEFDWRIVLAREDRHGDVVGFFHTHPSGQDRPSRRDRKTMRAWCDCLGKPLLCAIGGLGPTGDGVSCFLFRNYRSHGQRMRVWQFTDRSFDIGLGGHD